MNRKKALATGVCLILGALIWLFVPATDILLDVIAPQREVPVVDQAPLPVRYEPPPKPFAHAVPKSKRMRVLPGPPSEHYEPLTRSVKLKSMSPYHASPAPIVNTTGAANPGFKDALTDATSTFALDVDTASYTIARRALFNQTPESNPMYRRAPHKFQRTEPGAVRVEEWLNYFAADVPVEDGETFGTVMECARNPLSPDEDSYLIRIALKASEPPRKPWRLTFLVDVSGSMGKPNRLPIAKHAMKRLIEEMSPDDKIAIITYAGRNKLLVKHTNDKAKLLKAIDQMASSDTTAMGSGMELAYDAALKALTNEAVNRVVVFSDGDANIGNTTPEAILETVKSKREAGISLMTVGMGNDRFHDEMMETLANQGDGKYVYLDSTVEADQVFGQQAQRWMEDVAEDARSQVQFNPNVVKTWRQIGYENRQMANQDFRNDQKDAGEVGAGHLVTVLYEVTLHKNRVGKVADISIRYRTNGAFEERSWTLDSSAVKERVSEASPDFQFFTAVAGAAMLTTDPYSPNQPFTWSLINELVGTPSGPYVQERREFMQLVKVAERTFR